eukprot:Tamp_16922.p2 GENE.Tamp_16922~~Tamp_16922.p2  ORF type:complete len:174 (-),score=7.36 Tamp_16922:139-660(-)
MQQSQTRSNHRSQQHSTNFATAFCGAAFQMIFKVQRISVVADSEEGPLNVRIISPQNGATLQQASLHLALSGASLGAAGVRIEVSLDGEKVALIHEPPRTALTLDRDRTVRRNGLSWHTVTVELLDSWGAKMGISASSRFRLVGPKVIAVGPGLQVRCFKFSKFSKVLHIFSK